MTIVQVREDPENTLDGTDYVVPDLYAIDTGNNDYVLKVQYNDQTDTITVIDSVQIAPEKKITMKPEHFDVGRKHFVIMSPIDCSADESTGSAITNPSVWTYTFSTTLSDQTTVGATTW